MKSLDDMTEVELKKTITAACDALKAALPPGTGFIFLAAPYSGRVAQYGSNCHRNSAEEWMLETLLRWKRKEHIPR